MARPAYRQLRCRLSGFAVLLMWFVPCLAAGGTERDPLGRACPARGGLGIFHSGLTPWLGGPELSGRMQMPGASPLAYVRVRVCWLACAGLERGAHAGVVLSGSRRCPT